MSFITALFTFLLGTQAVFAQQKNTFIDPRDGKKYKTVKIGSQTWMAQNLDYHGEDGYFGLCYNKKCSKGYGRLYNWEEAAKACPQGWHLPSNEEWQVLVDFAGGYKIAGDKLKSKNGWRASRRNWKDGRCKYTAKETDYRGQVIYTEHDYCSKVTDEFGFAALPDGGGHPDGSFSGVGYSGGWWSSTEYDYIDDFAYYRYMDYDLSNVHNYIREKSLLFSVRCVQD